MDQFLNERNLKYLIGEDVVEMNRTLMKCVVQVARGLKFLHSHDIVHGNVKTGTIGCDARGIWKLGGLLNVEERENYLIASHDIRSLGLVVFQTCYPCNNFNRYVERLQHFPPKYPIDRIPFYSSAFDDTIKRMIPWNRCDMMTLDELIQFINNYAQENRNILNLTEIDTVKYQTEQFTQTFKFPKVLDSKNGVIAATRRDSKEQGALKAITLREPQINFLLASKLLNENIIRYFKVWRVDSNLFTNEWAEDVNRGTFPDKYHFILEMEAYKCNQLFSLIQ